MASNIPQRFQLDPTFQQNITTQRLPPRHERIYRKIVGEFPSKLNCIKIYSKEFEFSGCVLFPGKFWGGNPEKHAVNPKQPHPILP